MLFLLFWSLMLSAKAKATAMVNMRATGTTAPSSSNLLTPVCVASAKAPLAPIIPVVVADAKGQMGKSDDKGDNMGNWHFGACVSRFYSPLSVSQALRRPLPALSSSLMPTAKAEAATIAMMVAVARPCIAAALQVRQQMPERAIFIHGVRSCRERDVENPI